MRAWSGEGGQDIMGDAVARPGSGQLKEPPPLKNGSDLRESGYLIAVGSRTARFRRKHKHKALVVVLFVLLLLLLCLAIVMTVLYVKQKKHKPVRVCETRECLRSAANLAVSMDPSVDPCNDFYQYVCGKWSEEHPRPDSYRSFDWFRDKQTKVYNMVRDFLAKNSSDQPKPVQQAKDMYTACMDTELLDKRGVKPVVQVLEALGLPPYPTYVNATPDFDYSTYTFDWLAVITKVKTYLGMDIFIGFDIFSDPKNSSVYRLVMGSPETTNPFPSMYAEKKRHTYRKYLYHNLNLKSSLLLDSNFEKKASFLLNRRKSEKSDDEYDVEDENREKTRQIFTVFYAEIIKLFVAESGVEKSSNLTVLELEQNMLQSALEYFNVYSLIYELESSNDTQSEDYDLVIPEYTVAEIQAHTDMVVEDNDATPIPIWGTYLEGVFQVSNVSLDLETEKILVSDPDLKYMALMASFLANQPLVKMELYVWIKVVEVLAVHTTTELRMLFQRSYDELREKGHGDSAAGLPARSLQCASAVNDMLGMAVSYGIADPHFHNVTKPKVQIMINEMKNALARLIGKAKWMDDDTKLATYEKILEMRSLIGFPDWLLEDGLLEEYYEGVEVHVDEHLENMINIIQVRIRSALNKYHDIKNYSWATDPTEVNAYHSFQENTITVPLVMLQYPFYDLGLESLNYGSLGTIIGHEITHGFDNFGRQFDKNGNMLPWWSNTTIASFINMTQCFIDQYSNFYIHELDEHVDGKRTLGENIADNGGVREAFAALKEHLHKYGPEPKLPGFEHMTSEQLFFLSYGNLWCEVSTSDYLKVELDDEHSPQKFRARGALQNSAEFARAWHCRPGAPMSPTSRCIIF